MWYFEVSFIATLNGSNTKTGTIGVRYRTNDYLPSQVKDIVRSYYKKSDSSVRTVGVVISGHESLDRQKYESRRQTFLEVIEK